jgi:WD40 repeat protein
VLPLQGFHPVVAAQVDVCFAPDGRAAASASVDGLRVWRFLPAFAARIPRAATPFGPSLSISDSGETVVVSGRMSDGGQSVLVWPRCPAGTTLVRSRLSSTVGRPVISSNGRWLALSRIRDDGIPEFAVVRVRQQADQDTIAALRNDLRVRLDPFWLDCATRTLLLGSSDGAVRIWRVGSGTGLVSELQVVHQFDSECTCITMDSRRRWLAAACEGAESVGRVAVWRATGRTLDESGFERAFKPAYEFATEPYTWNVALVGGDEGRPLVVTTGSCRDVCLWDPKTQQRVDRLGGHRDAVFRCLSLDDDVLVTASRDYTVRIWDTREREELCVLYESRDEQPAIVAANGRIVIADGGTIMVADRRELEEFIRGNRDYEIERLRHD